MQAGYGGRGRGMSRGRGGAGGFDNPKGLMRQPFIPSTTPTDTLCVRITEIRQPVTEDMMYRVFASISTNPRRLQISPSSDPNETLVMAQFSDSYATQRVMESLNNRNIFNDGNKMMISYSSWEPSPVLPAPTSVGSVYGAPGQVYGGVQVVPNVGFPQAQGQPGAYPQVRQPQVQQMPQMPMQVMMPQMRVGNDQHGGRGGRGRGRGGARGAGGVAAPGPMMGFDPMMMGYPAMAPMMQMPNGMMAAYANQKNVAQNTPTVFLSVTIVPETEPLYSIFVLIEVFGGVVTIRRNHNKKEILTVKMASVPEADNVVQYLRKVPFAGGTVSAKRFPTYNERTPCTDDGNPHDSATIQYDFTTARHRSPGQRSKCQPSTVLKVTGCGGYSEADVMTYFTSENFYPDRIIKDDEGAFTVHMADRETAVALLLKCHNNVCGEERSNVLFIEGPKEAASATNAASGSTNTQAGATTCDNEVEGGETNAVS
ncbi:unnamed protein product [Trypanosoma congolense IL3000]|uniref:WGS project CAEQ00000000 data, annotated contig 1514 n=1 Tax=Trypanosoma congolense (strain IL3000) TaxID=1068625 RepID=F9W6S0_TRYCI|nr:unnamed protein product [Trypanosoma congolense IL3000]